MKMPRAGQTIFIGSRGPRSVLFVKSRQRVSGTYPERVMRYTLIAADGAEHDVRLYANGACILERDIASVERGSLFLFSTPAEFGVKARWFFSRRRARTWQKREDRYTQIRFLDNERIFGYIRQRAKEFQDGDDEHTVANYCPACHADVPHKTLRRAVDESGKVVYVEVSAQLNEKINQLASAQSIRFTGEQMSDRFIEVKTNE